MPIISQQTHLYTPSQKEEMDELKLQWGILGDYHKLTVDSSPSLLSEHSEDCLSQLDGSRETMKDTFQIEFFAKLTQYLEMLRAFLTENKERLNIEDYFKVMLGIEILGKRLKTGESIGYKMMIDLGISPEFIDAIFLSTDHQSGHVSEQFSTDLMKVL